MKNNLKRVLGYSFAIAFAWVASFGDANAILVKGHIDPEFQSSGQLNNLFWTADIQFNVGSECVVANFTGQCNSVSGFSIDGTLEFMGEEIDVQYPQLPVPTIDLQVNSVGTIIGIGTSEIGPSALWSFQTHTGSGYAWLDFNLPSGDNPSSAQLFLQFCTEVGIIPDFSFSRGATLSSVNSYGSWCESPDACTIDRGAADPSNVFAKLEITQIPEPATALLLLGALAAGWIVRRRSV